MNLKVKVNHGAQIVVFPENKLEFVNKKVP